MITVLHGHTTPETAHLTFAYPFGRQVVCVRREWLERGTKGAGRGQYRFVTQTTEIAFNRAYTSRISEGTDGANTWAQEAIAAGGQGIWNAAKTSTYHHFAVMTQAPLEDGSGRHGTFYASLTPYESSAGVAEFKAKYFEQLDDFERGFVLSLEERVRRAETARAEYEARSLAQTSPTSTPATSDPAAA